MYRKVGAIIGLIILSLVIFGSGVVLGQMGWSGVNQGNMMGTSGQSYYGTMNGSMMGSGMTNGQMMGGMMSGRMMTLTNPDSSAEPLSIDDAESAVELYLATLDSDDFAIGEIMIFENHAYAQLVEKSSGIGAMELLVDPVTLAVSPEPGPNMMWNLRYSPMADGGMMGMMSGFADRTAANDTAMPLSAAEAVVVAQRYLDAQLPGTRVEAEADRFYGYYTLHILSAEETIGMLSVNGYTGEVFLHSWHGDFVAMDNENH